MKKLAILGCSQSCGQYDDRGKHETMLEYGYWVGWPHDIYEKYNYETHVYSYPGGGIQDVFFTLNYFLSNKILFDKIIIQLTSEPRFQYWVNNKNWTENSRYLKFKKFTNPNKTEQFYRWFIGYGNMSANGDPASSIIVQTNHYMAYLINLLDVIDYFNETKLFDILGFHWTPMGDQKISIPNFNKKEIKFVKRKISFKSWLIDKIGDKKYTLHFIDGGSHLDEAGQKYLVNEYLKNELDEFLL